MFKKIFLVATLCGYSLQAPDVANIQDLGLEDQGLELVEQKNTIPLYKKVAKITGTALGLSILAALTGVFVCLRLNEDFGYNSGYFCGTKHIFVPELPRSLSIILGKWFTDGYSSGHAGIGLAYIESTKDSPKHPPKTLHPNPSRADL